MKKFELFMGCLGNGITVCNKAVEENGDYKVIAHIANCGNIKYYVPINYIPGDALLRIEHEADTMYHNWKNQLDKMPLTAKYSMLLDIMPMSEFLNIVKNKAMSIEEKCDYMENVCFNKHLAL